MIAHFQMAEAKDAVGVGVGVTQFDTFRESGDGAREVVGEILYGAQILPSSSEVSEFPDRPFKLNFRLLVLSIAHVYISQGIVKNGAG